MKRIKEIIFGISCISYLTHCFGLRFPVAELSEKIKREYGKYSGTPLPIEYANRSINIGLGLSLIQILNLDAKQGILTTNCWTKMKWKDDMISWDPKNYAGIDQIRLPIGSIWSPDIVLYNTVDKRMAKSCDFKNSLAVISNDGNLYFSTKNIYMSACQIDITYFPFDIQQCTLKFASWLYHGLDINITFFDEQQEIALKDYNPNSQWQLINSPAHRHIKYFPCCKEPFPEIEFILHLRRVPGYYIYTLISPCILLSLLTMVMFLMPCDSTDKLGFGMNIFLGFMLLLLVLSDSIPSSGSSMPQIGIFYGVNIMLITGSMLVSVFIININKTNTHRKVPKCMKVIFIDCLARCMRVNKGERKNIALNYDIPNGLTENKPIEHETESMEERKIKLEWNTIAVVFDRLLLITYVSGLTLSFLILFPTSSA